MQTRIKPRRGNAGFTYAAVICTAIVVGATLASYLKMVSSQNQMTMRSQAWNRSVPVLEAGIEEALAHLNKNAAADSAGIFHLNLNSDGWTPVGGGFTKTNWVGEDYYVVTISGFTPGTDYPFIDSVGYVKQLPTFASKVKTFPFLAAVSGLNLSRTSEFTRRAVSCTTTNVPAFSKGLLARREIDLKGNNVMTDSYDSRITRIYNPLHARDNGDIGTNLAITNSMNLGNANIYGKVATGPRGTVSLGSQGGVGTRTWVAANPGKIQPGYSSDDMNVEFREVTLPYTTSVWSPVTETIDGKTYKVFGASGASIREYVVDGIDSSVMIKGPSRIVVNGDINLTGQETFVVNSNAFVSLYMNGATAKFGGNGIVNGAGVATNLYYFGTTNNIALELGGNGQLTAAVYAPQAALKLNGGGSGAEDFSGAAMVDTIQFNGHFKFHYDEALPKIGIYRGYVITSWNER